MGKSTIPAFSVVQHVVLLIAVVTEMTGSISLILKTNFLWPNKGVY